MSSTSFKSNIKGSYLKTSVFTSIRNKIERRLTTFETPWSLEQLRGYSFSTYVKFSKKLTFLTP